jgi:hypothetical protein
VIAKSQPLFAASLNSQAPLLASLMYLNKRFLLKKFPLGSLNRSHTPPLRNCHDCEDMYVSESQRVKSGRSGAEFDMTPRHGSHWGEGERRSHGVWGPAGPPPKLIIDSL